MRKSEPLFLKKKKKGKEIDSTQRSSWNEGCFFLNVAFLFLSHRGFLCAFFFYRLFQGTRGVSEVILFIYFRRWSFDASSSSLWPSVSRRHLCAPLVCCNRTSSFCTCVFFPSLFKNVELFFFLIFYSPSPPLDFFFASAPTTSFG